MYKTNEQIAKDFEEKYCNFEISERISKPDMQNILNFFITQREEDKKALIEKIEDTCAKGAVWSSQCQNIVVIPMSVLEKALS